MNTIFIKKGKDKALKSHHPWVFSGAINKIKGEPVAGETVQIRSHKDNFLAIAAFSPESQIRARVWSFDEVEIDESFFHDRLKIAKSKRAKLIADENIDSYRVVNAESDGLPGVIVDIYQQFICCQFLTTGAEQWRESIVKQLKLLYTDIKGIYERSDSDSRIREGLEKRSGLLWGDEPDDQVEICENGVKIIIDIKKGDNTGFYLDQRNNRKKLKGYCKGKSVLNCFSYTGGFGLNALSGGALDITNIDQLEGVLDLATKNVELNEFAQIEANQIQGDVFALLRKYRDMDKKFDVIILDPPKFAETKHQVNKAARAYKDINLLAIKLLNPSGILFTFSRSAAIGEALFQKIVADAALDAKRSSHIIERLSQAEDFPVALNFPEAQFLNGLICSVD